MFTVFRLIVISSFFLSVAVRYWAIALTLLFGLSVNLSFAAEEGYQINKGDKLRIAVWKEENLNTEVMVSPDGTITFPMVDTIPAAGKTLDELQTLLREKLEEYIPGPEVSVSLLTVEGNVIYIIGEVSRPGSFTMTKNLKVMQALSLAGGLTPFASRNDIRILRETVDGKSISIPFEYGEVEDGDALDSNIRLQSDDTIIVP